jgi:hypothetical protein
MTGTPVEHQRMIFGKKILDDKLTLEHYQIEHNSIVWVVRSVF